MDCSLAETQLNFIILNETIHILWQFWIPPFILSSFYTCYIYLLTLIVFESAMLSLINLRRGLRK